MSMFQCANVKPVLKLAVCHWIFPCHWDFEIFNFPISSCQTIFLRIYSLLFTHPTLTFNVCLAFALSAAKAPTS